jgi:DNA-binding IclR family transcriptional regulator
MVELTDDDNEVLQIMYKEERANPYLIREETGLNKGDVNTILNRLGRAGFIRQVTRGLYEITEAGKSEVVSIEE